MTKPKNNINMYNDNSILKPCFNGYGFIIKTTILIIVINKTIPYITINTTGKLNFNIK